MIWARIRFIMTESGGYSQRLLAFETNSFVVGAMMAETLGSGWHLATGYKCITEGLTRLKGVNDHEYYVMPKDFEKLRAVLKEGIIV